MALHPHLIYSGEFTIQTYEIDRHKRATIASLIKLMQEAAMQNVINLGLSVWDLESQCISWVIMRMDFELSRLPLLNEKIRVVTHGAGFLKFFTYRDYKVYDTEDNLIAKASSTWLLMDTNSRRMTRIPQHILDFQTPENCLPRPKNKLPKFEKADRSQIFRVDWHNLDFNQHLSNIYYIQWMLEVIDENLLNNGIMTKVEILYKKESYWKDEVISELQIIDSLTFRHRLLRKSDGQELVRAQTYWKKS